MKNSKISENDLNQVYVVIESGNIFRYANSDKKRALRYAERLASKGHLVELCYFYNSVDYDVLKYWN